MEGGAVAEASDTEIIEKLRHLQTVAGRTVVKRVGRGWQYLH